MNGDVVEEVAEVGVLVGEEAAVVVVVFPLYSRIACVVAVAVVGVGSTPYVDKGVSGNFDEE